MKIRNGFVSNSSSSSFIVNIKEMNLSDLAVIVIDFVYIIEDICNINKELKRNIKNYKIYIEEYINKKNNTGLFQSLIDNYIKKVSKNSSHLFKLKQFTKKLKFNGDITDIKLRLEILKELFDIYDIKYKEIDDTVKLEYYVTMDNGSVIDDIPRLLSKLILQFQFDKDLKDLITCTKLPDSENIKDDI